MSPGAPGFPPTLACGLEGWELVWAVLVVDEPGSGLDGERSAAAERLVSRLRGSPLVEDPVVQSVRGLFRAAGTDPTRYRPSSEALARRVLKGGALPAILPAVDVNNVWSLDLLVPCCVIDPVRLRGDLALRRGRADESMTSMRGAFNLEGKPLLADEEGPFGTPITDSERVKVTGTAGTFWLVAYLPQGVVASVEAGRALTGIVDRVGGARIQSITE
jgi:DNA/RNA-binding domain of Phe-tRNA-synthetase-like protein